MDLRHHLAGVFATVDKVLDLRPDAFSDQAGGDAFA
jgi:hypothetical protein